MGSPDLFNAEDAEALVRGQNDVDDAGRFYVVERCDFWPWELADEVSRGGL
jgi:hypothetical protein